MTFTIASSSHKYEYTLSDFKKRAFSRSPVTRPIKRLTVASIEQHAQADNHRIKRFRDT
ncbi:hypothetical protein [Acinetobacter sp. YH12153]|uniref:hypothetical protein n=1 Tax=Acinetobacter sp. YH12153 TaxID=2601133 RepID=UPI0015D3DDEF|nr:hypothetical protein [Acinetobacter sp. YH12153]